MNDQLTITFEYSPVDHANAMTEWPDRRALFKWWRPVTVGGVALMFFVQGGHRSFQDASLAKTSILLLLLLPVMLPVLFMPELVKRTIVRRFRREKAARADPIETRSFGPDGFKPGSEWSLPIPWALVTKAVESERFFFVYHAHSNAPEYVPKASMSAADVDGLRMMLRHQFQERPAALKLLATTEPLGALG